MPLTALVELNEAYRDACSGPSTPRLQPFLIDGSGVGNSPGLNVGGIAFIPLLGCEQCVSWSELALQKVVHTLPIKKW
jgi:hypothetical protein